MLLIIFLVLWVFSLFYGIRLIRADRRRLAVLFLFIFSIPIFLFLIADWFIDFSYLNCMFRKEPGIETEEWMDYCRSL